MSKFEVLTDAEHIRKRAQMYVGSITPESVTYTDADGLVRTEQFTPAMMKVVNEIIDNSVDESVRVRKAGFKIQIEVGSDGYIFVRDNGRGIPDVQHNGHSQLELALGRARAGSNFNDDERTSIGMNGVGSYLTNVLSTHFIARSKTKDSRKNRAQQITWKDGKMTEDRHVDDSGETGMAVRFLLDYKFFGQTGFTAVHCHFLHKRAKALAVTHPGLEITISDQGSTTKYFYKNNKQALAAVVPEASEFETVDGENFILAFGSSGEAQEFQHETYVNGLSLPNAGSSVDYLINEVIERLRPSIKRQHKLELTPGLLRQSLRLISYARNFPKPKFDSQTKERLTNSRAEVAEFYKDLDLDKLARAILKNDLILKPIIQAALSKQARAEALELAKEKKKLSKKRVVNHIAATHPDENKRTLVIAEGLSALGSLIEVRDAKLHGGYSLKGKIPNTMGLKYTEIIQNKELSDLLAITGLELGKPAKNLNYGKICLMADQDEDGKNIICLLVNFFSNWRELFEEGRIYRLNTPIIVATKKNQEKFFYTTEEFHNAKLGSDWKIDYKKGIGSLTRDQYAAHIHDPYLTRIDWKTAADYQALVVAFGDDVSLRKQWLS